MPTHSERLLEQNTAPASALDFSHGLFSMACKELPGLRNNGTGPDHQVLIVGGESSARLWVSTLLERQGQAKIVMASDVQSAIAILHQQPCAVLLMNLSPNGPAAQGFRLNGVGLISKAKALDQAVQIIVLVDRSELHLGVQMMRAGAFDCLTTDQAPQEIVSCIIRALGRRQEILNERVYNELIERTVYQRTTDLNTMVCELEEAYRQTLWALGSALETRDVETNAHCFRVMKYSQALASAMGIDGKALKDIEYGVFLHDIGKIGVTDAILFKPGKLTELEWVAMRQHPARGRYLLAGIKFLEGGLDIVYCHHERWDGTGYPQGLSADRIPLGARIFAVGDTLDAMTSDRPYRKALSYETARSEILTNSGIQFDRSVVQIFREFTDSDWNRLREEAEDLARSVVQRKYESLGTGLAETAARSISPTPPGDAPSV
jgi:response regulator RpfG family c-di-GMP phosphodiesterase